MVSIGADVATKVVIPPIEAGGVKAFGFAEVESGKVGPDKLVSHAAVGM